MKRNNAILILTIFLLFGMTHNVYAADAEWRCMRGEQEALVLGTILEISGDLYTIQVAKPLSCVTYTWDDYNMLPFDQIPDILIVKLINNNYNLINGTCRVGDNIVISLIQKDGYWQRMWHMLKVSSLDVEELRVYSDKNEDSLAWEIFIKSDGTKALEGNGEGFINVATYDKDGKKISTERIDVPDDVEESSKQTEAISSTQTTEETILIVPDNKEATIDINKRDDRAIIIVLIIAVVFIALTVIAYKKRKK